MPNVEEELDRLYGLPLEEFTAARNDLAKRLKGAGDGDGAEAVAGLRKPPLTAWAVNRAAREAPERVAALNEAGRELFEAQRGALGGGGTSGFEAAQQRHRDAVREAVGAARSVLERAGRRPADTALERIAATLRAASVEEEGRRLLEAGRLEDDFEGSGMFLLAGAATGRKPRAPAKQADARAPRRAAEVRAARSRAREAKDAARTLDRKARRSEASAERAEAEAARLGEEARVARAEADRAAREVEDTERALRDLREQ